MKTKIYNIVTLSLLTIYFVFSSGIFFSVHYCCKHCHATVKVEYCECAEHEHDHSSTSEDQQKEHHKCHDKHFFFKILEDYDKIDSKPSPVGKLSLIYIIDYSSDSYLTALFNNILKTNELLPSHPVIQGDSFLDFLQQWVYYA